MNRNYNLDCDDYAAIDKWGEGASEKYGVDSNGLWYKEEGGGR